MKTDPYREQRIDLIREFPHHCPIKMDQGIGEKFALFRQIAPQEKGYEDIYIDFPKQEVEIFEPCLIEPLQKWVNYWGEPFSITPKNRQKGFLSPSKLVEKLAPEVEKICKNVFGENRIRLRLSKYGIHIFPRVEESLARPYIYIATRPPIVKGYYDSLTTQTKMFFEQYKRLDDVRKKTIKLFLPKEESP